MKSTLSRLRGLRHVEFIWRTVWAKNCHKVKPVTLCEKTDQNRHFCFSDFSVSVQSWRKRRRREHPRSHVWGQWHTTLFQFMLLSIQEKYLSIKYVSLSSCCHATGRYCSGRQFESQSIFLWLRLPDAAWCFGCLFTEWIKLLHFTVWEAFFSSFDLSTLQTPSALWTDFSRSSFLLNLQWLNCLIPSFHGCLILLEW